MAFQFDNAAGGAAAGATLGSAAGPIGTGVGAVVGGLAGGFLSPKKKKAPKPQQIDITAQLAMIDAMYNQQKQQARTTLAESLKGLNKLTAQSLAGRGIYSSPVSQFSFGENQKSYAQALSQALSDLGAQQAMQKAQLSAQAQQFNMGQQGQYDQSMYQQQLASRQALSQALWSIGGVGLNRMLSSGGTPTPDMVQSQTPSNASVWATPQQMSTRQTVNQMGNMNMPWQPQPQPSNYVRRF